MPELDNVLRTVTANPHCFRPYMGLAGGADSWPQVFGLGATIARITLCNWRPAIPTLGRALGDLFSCYHHNGDAYECFSAGTFSQSPFRLSYSPTARWSFLP